MTKAAEVTLFQPIVKRCNRCGIAKPASAFPRNTASRDGLYSLCVTCKRTAERAASQARKARKSERAREHYAANRERILSRNRQWSARNREEHALLKRRINANRRAAKFGAAGDCSLAAFRARWSYYAGLCWVCGLAASEVDHVIPLSRGGTGWPANLRPVCRECNAARRGRDWRACVRDVARRPLDVAA